MNKMIAILLDSEAAAYDGVRALEDLHYRGDLTVFATAVVARNTDGSAKIVKPTDQDWAGTAVGLFTGGLVGLLGGPIGIAVGAASGTMLGCAYDLIKSDIDMTFGDEIAQKMGRGKFAVIAEVYEEWVTPLDSAISPLGGTILRRPRMQVVEDELTRETESLKQEIEVLKEEQAEVRQEHKAAIQARIDELQQRLEKVQARAKARMEDTKSEWQKRVEKMQSQVTHAAAEKKASVQRHIEDVKADLAIRHEKLNQARKLAGEALFPPKKEEKEPALAGK